MFFLYHFPDLKRFFLVFTMLTFFLATLSSEGWISPEEEAPKALFQSKIGDADVDFFINGSWSTLLGYSTGLMLGQGIPLMPIDYFPGEVLGFTYENMPDLTLSARLMDKYFLELSVLGGFSENSILMGYEGDENDVLEMLHIGNRDIGFEPFPYMDIPNAGDSSIGGEAILRSGENSRHHIILRYDSQKRESVKFLGKNQIEEERIGVKNYMKNRYFYLPDSEVENLRVYIADPAGNFLASDGKKYSLLDSNEYVFSNSQGLLYFNNPLDRRILLYYEKNGKPIGDVTIGKGGLPGTAANMFDFDKPPIDFNWGITYLGTPMTERRIEVDSKNCFLLYDPGSFNPFAISSTYAIQSDLPGSEGDVDIKLVRTGSSNEKLFKGYRVSFKLEKEKKQLVLVPSDAGTSTTSGNSSRFRQFFPLPDPEGRIYGPEAFMPGKDADYEIMLTLLSPVDGYILGEGIIPGSVKILRNGIDETRYKVDYTTGEIEFETEIYPGDLIEVSYLKEGSSFNGGDILVGWGNKIALSDYLLLNLGAALRWNILSGSYTEGDEERNGSFLSSVGIEYSRKNVNINLNGAAGYSNPDTTGNYRIDGMEGSERDLEISEENVYPSSVPVALPTGVSGINADNRGKLYYKDYRSYGPLGSVSMYYYEDAIPPDQIYPYESGSRTGPYIAGGSSEGRKGKSLVMDYEMGETEEWVGSLLLLRDPGYNDLSDTDTIAVSYRGYGISGDVDLYIQVGETGEDLDGDGKLDSEKDESSPGFSFDDPSSNVTLSVGGGPDNRGNAFIDSEDTDGNGFLDAEDVTHVVSSAPVSLSGDTDWKVYTVHLTTAERSLLRKCRAIRFLIVRKGTGSLKGRILIDRVSLYGSPYWADADPPGNVSVTEIREEDGKYDPGFSGELTALFPEVKNTFHGNGEEQEVLQVDWASIPQGGSWYAGRYYEKPFTPSAYRKFVLYLRLPYANLGSSAFFFMKLQSVSGVDTVVNLPITDSPLGNDSSWHRVEVDFNDGSVSIDGEKTEGSIENYSGEPVSGIKFGISDSAEGTLYIDELHLEESVGHLGVSLSLESHFKFPGNLLTIGKLPILSEAEIGVASRFTTPGFSALYGVAGDALDYDSNLHLKGKLLGMNTVFDTTLIGRNDDIGLLFQHTLTFPLYRLPVRILESYTESYLDYRFVSTRDTSVEMKADGVADINLVYSHLYREGVLRRTWGTTLGLSGWNLITSTLSVDFGLAEENGSYPRSTYPSDWITSFSYLYPSDVGADEERSMRFAETLRMGNERAASVMDIDAGVRSFNFHGGTEDREGTLDVTFSLPLNEGKSGSMGISVEPAYSRKFKLGRTLVEGKDIWSDISEYGDEIKANSYFFTNIPFKEIFSGETLADFTRATASFGSVKYEPSFSLQFSRNYGSRIMDLFLPSVTNLSIGRELSRDFDTVTSSGSASVGIKNTALNLFGRMGSFPFFDFFSSDEYNITATYDIESEDWKIIDGFSLLIDAYVTLSERKRWDSTFENKLKVDQTSAVRIENDTNLSFRWRADVPPLIGHLSFGLLDPGVLEGIYMENEESLHYSFLRDEGKDLLRPVTVTLEHSTALKVSQKGHIKALIGLGFDYFDSIVRLLIKVTLEGKISF